MPTIASVDDCKSEYTQFNDNTTLIKTSLQLSSAIYSGPILNTFPAWTQSKDNHLDGWTEIIGSSLYSAIARARINAYEFNVVTVTITPSIATALISKGLRYITLSSVSQRPAFGNGGEFEETGGGGGVSIPELDFSVGGIWNPRMFADQNFSIEFALKGGFLPRRRPSAYSRPYDMSLKTDQLSNKRATLHIVGLDGTRWMSTTDFMLESVSRVHQLKFDKISSFDGHTLAFDCNTNEIYNFSGKLLDAKGFDQARTWSYNWDRYIDPNVLAKNKSRVMLIYKDKIVVGYIIGFQSASSAASRFVDSLSFSMYVSDFIISDNLKNKDQVTTESSGNYYKDKDAWDA